MRYKKFKIQAYKAIADSEIAVTETPIPIIGVNESGKSSALEAIAHFDFRNDEIIKQKRWSYRNRYKPDESEFSVTCDVEISQAEFEKIRQPLLLPQPEQSPLPTEPTPEQATEPAQESATVTPNTTPPAQVEAPDTSAAEPIPQPEPVNDELKDINIDGNNVLSITRTFNAKDDSTAYLINGTSGSRVEELAKVMIGKLARIYYFDNFLETPMPDVVTFSKSYIDGTDDKLDEQQAIVEGAFSDSGVNLREFFKNKDGDSQATLISTVSDNVTKKIIEDWRKMHVTTGEVDVVEKLNNITIMFKLGDNKKSIEIKVLEQFPRKDGTLSPPITMKVSERSLGFRWFFNFSARKCFAAVHQEQFLYLIDEPGSYLHNSAQTILLDALIDLAKQHPLIFSTHSEFLLDPEKININRIKIVQKDDYAIKLIPLSNASVKKHEGALSTLYNALKMRTPLESVMGKKVIVTEGITDFYFWKPIIDIAFLPGSGAGNNRYLLSIAIGASRKYLAIFDGDGAGDTARANYEVIFGQAESQNWLAYQKSQGTPCELEQLLSAADTARIKTISGQTDIKQAITMLFFNKKTAEFWKGIDAETKANVQHNINRFATQLNLTSGNISQGFTVSTGA